MIKNNSHNFSLERYKFEGEKDYSENNNTYNIYNLSNNNKKSYLNDNIYKNYETNKENKIDYFKYITDCNANSCNLYLFNSQTNIILSNKKNNSSNTNLRSKFTFRKLSDAFKDVSSYGIDIEYIVKSKNIYF